MDASSGGCSTPPPWHINAVGGRPPHQGVSARDSLPERWRVCSDGSSRCASQSANTLQKPSRQQESAVISTAIEGVSGTGLEAQSSQTDAVKSLIRWESPHPLSIAGVNIGNRAQSRRLPLRNWRINRVGCRANRSRPQNTRHRLGADCGPDRLSERALLQAFRRQAPAFFAVLAGRQNPNGLETDLEFIVAKTMRSSPGSSLTSALR